VIILSRTDCTEQGSSRDSGVSVFLLGLHAVFVVTHVCPVFTVWPEHGRDRWAQGAYSPPRFLMYVADRIPSWHHPN